MQKLVFLVFFSLGLVVILQADSNTSHLGISLELVQPIRSFDISETMYGGINFRGKLLRILGGNFSIHYIRKSYFDFYQQMSWSGPDSLDNIAYTGGDWIFYQTEWVFAFNLAFYLPLGRLQPYLVTGPAWIVYAKSEAADYYPEFNDYFLYNEKNADLYLGYLARLGVEYFIFDQWTIGFDYIFKVDRTDTFIEDFTANPGEYMKDKSNLILTCSFWPL